MATLILNAYPAERDGPFLTIALCLGGNPPLPREKVEVRTAADCTAALEAYAEKARALDTGIQVSMRIERGSRSPRGFKNIAREIEINT